VARSAEMLHFLPTDAYIFIQSGATDISFYFT